MTGIYRRLGITPIINARGTHTRLGGSLMAPEVLEAMREAAGAYVVLDELQERASEVIARATGAEAGFVTGGAAAGLLVATAACIAGPDPILVDQLPDTAGMRGEAIMFKAHRNGYDHSVRASGVRVVETGYPHATLPHQFEAAFSERTAVVVYLMSPWASRGALSLPDTVAIAHRHGVPVLVDAAAMLPPAANLRRFIAEGADLVVFSGGKAIGGPQSSGMLAGRADLVAAARMHGSPHHSIGRTGKAAKEDIVGFIVALERYLERDHAAEERRWRAQGQVMTARLGGLPGIDVAYRHDASEHHTPRVEIVIDPATGIDAHEVVVALEAGSPRVFLFEPNNRSARPNSMVINTHTMQPGEEAIVGEVVRAALVARLERGGGR